MSDEQHNIDETYLNELLYGTTTTTNILDGTNIVTTIMTTNDGQVIYLDQDGNPIPPPPLPEETNDQTIAKAIAALEEFEQKEKAQKEAKRIADEKREQKMVDYSILVRKRMEGLFDVCEGTYGAGNFEFQLDMFPGVAATPEQIGAEVLKKLRTKPQAADFIATADVEANKFVVTRPDMSFGHLGHFVFYIPEMEVTPEVGNKKHKMIECYFKVTLTYGMTVTSTKFFRAVRTLEEFYSGYHFSHAGKGDWYPEGQKLCYGQHTPLDNIHAVVVNPCEEDDLAVYIVSLMPYLGYESKAGTPYVYLSEVKLPMDNRLTGSRLSDSGLRSVFQATVARVSSLNFARQPDGKISIPRDNELWKVVATTVPEGNRRVYNINTKSQTTASNSLEYRRRLMSAAKYHGAGIPSQLDLFFKGKRIVPKVIDTQVEQYEQEALEEITVCEEYIVDDVIRRLTEGINDYSKRKFHEHSLQ